MQDTDFSENYFVHDEHENALVLPDPGSLIRSLRRVLVKNSHRSLLACMRIKRDTPPPPPEDPNLTRIKNAALERAQISKSRDDALTPPSITWEDSSNTVRFTPIGMQEATEQSSVDTDPENPELVEIERARTSPTDEELEELIARAASTSPVENDRVLFNNPAADLIVTIGHIIFRIDADRLQYLTSVDFVGDFKTLNKILEQLEQDKDVGDIVKDMTYVLSRLKLFDPEFQSQEKRRIAEARAAAETALLSQANTTTAWSTSKATTSATTTDAESDAPACTFPRPGMCLVM